MTDFKTPARVKATRKEWAVLQVKKSGPCRVCGASAYTGNTSLHHLVPRSQRGDDVADNLVPLCGSGTTGCHGKIESRDKTASNSLRHNLTRQEEDYVTGKKGLMWLNWRYPLFHLDIPKADGIGLDDIVDIQHETRQLSGVATSKKDHVIEISEGHKCPTCHRRVPYEAKPSTPTSRPWSMRIPEESRESFKEVLEAAAHHTGSYTQPWFQFNTVMAGLVLLLQGEADVLAEDD